MSPIEVVRAKEEEIRGNRFESAFAVDEVGRVLLDKRGEQFHVGFTQEEIDRLLAGQGVLFTHNHPRGWDYSPQQPTPSRQFLLRHGREVRVSGGDRGDARGDASPPLLLAPVYGRLGFGNLADPLGAEL